MDNKELNRAETKPSEKIITGDDVVNALFQSNDGHEPLRDDDDDVAVGSYDAS